MTSNYDKYPSDEMEDPSKNSTSKSAKAALIGSVIIASVAGCGMYIWGNMSNYVVSYLYEFDKSISYDAAFQIDFSVRLTCALAHFFGIYLLNKLGLSPRLVVLIGGLLLSGGFIVASYLSSLSWLTLAFAFVGFGDGIIYIVPIQLLW